EHDVIIRHRQQVGLAFGQPFLGRCTLAFWAVPIAAGVVGDRRIGAVLTARDMAAEGCGAAALDRRHHLELAEAHMAGIGWTPSGPIVAENVRDLQRWARHARCTLGGRLVLGFTLAGTRAY